MKKNITGFSLIEMLIVVGVFGILAVLVTQSIANTIRGTEKSLEIQRVRDNLDTTATVMERHLRNAKLITSACDGSDLNTISYTDDQDTAGSFICNLTDGYVASASATNRITSSTIDITECKFVCTSAGDELPESIDIHLSGESTKFSGGRGASATVDTKVILRNY